MNCSSAQSGSIAPIGGIAESHDREGGRPGRVESVAVSSDAAAKPVRYAPGMDARSTRVAERLNTPMLVAAALTLPTVAITESQPGGLLEDVAIASTGSPGAPS